MSVSHSVMFHHFHNKNHLPAQGSLSADDFAAMLDWLTERYNLIGSKNYIERFESASLDPLDICLSFDDALLCQYEIAVPILEDRGIDAFFFIYSSVFTAEPDYLEIYRYFRSNSFVTLDEFYQNFFLFAEDEIGEELIRHKDAFEKLDYLGAFPFYTEQDKWFRYLRDQILGEARYAKIMKGMMSEKNFLVTDIVKKLWMSEENVKELAKRGHSIGLHSHSHPTKMSKLSYQDQFLQYQNNLHHLNHLVGDVISMSHPCGDYNSDTLNILDDMGIRIGFRSDLRTTKTNSKFEIPREDHANVFRAMHT